LSIGIYLSFPFAGEPVKGLEWGRVQFRPDRAAFYLDCLLLEILSSVPKSDRKAASLLWGAGDWSLVSDKYLTHIGSALRKKFDFSTNCKFTVESSPNHLAYGKLKTLRQLGANRLSLNLLNLNLAELKKSISLFRRASFRDINFDLHFGKPGQSLKKWRQDLGQLLRLKPTHISLYSFGSGKSLQRLKREIYFNSLEALNASGFRQYEICHFCLPGYESRQNLIYWRRKNYLGFGAGASSLWDNNRFQNFSNPLKYILQVKRTGTAFSSSGKLDRETVVSEEIYFALRQPRGLNPMKMRKACGHDFWETRQGLLDRLLAKGLLARRGGHLTLTKEAYLIADNLIAKLI